MCCWSAFGTLAYTCELWNHPKSRERERERDVSTTFSLKFTVGSSQILSFENRHATGEYFEAQLMVDEKAEELKKIREDPARSLSKLSEYVRNVLRVF